MTLRKIARFVSLMLTALSTGVFFGTRTSLGPPTTSFAPDTYVEVQQATVRNLRPVMGVLLPAAVAINAAVALTARGRLTPAFWLTLLGLFAQAASAALTVGIELPINSRVLTWSPGNPPEGWEEMRDRWARVHTYRTATSLVGLACLVAAAVATEGRADGTAPTASR